MRSSIGKRLAMNSGADTLLIGSSTERTALLFTISAVTPVLLGNLPLTSITDANGVFSLNASGIQTVELRREIHGDIVTQAWHAWCGIANVGITVLESFR